MNSKYRLILSILIVSLSACSVANTVQVKGTVAPGEHFITTGGIDRPYESLGFVQVTKHGVGCVGGFLPIVRAGLEEGLNEVLMEEMRDSGADGIINVTFQELQIIPFARAILTILFFWPVPESVLITGELVKLK